MKRLSTLIDRRLNPADIQSICVIILLVFSSLMFLSIYSYLSGRPLFRTQLGADFIAFYNAGKIYNEFSPLKIYDQGQQQKMLIAQMPDATPDERYPYVNAPFFILPFLALARLSFIQAYLCWLVISIAGFGIGFMLLWKTLNAIPREHFKLALLVGFTFMPLLVECLAGGQTTAFGFLVLSIAFFCERNGYDLLCGIALSSLSYKPTLLLLILPMLLCTRRYRALAGCVVGGLILTLISYLAVGREGCESFIRMLFYFADHSTGLQTGLKSWKYVDLNSFFRLLAGEHSTLRWGMAGLSYILISPVLLMAWMKTERSSEIKQTLIWALTITWTLVANIYLGIYDSALVLISALLVLQVAFRLRMDDSGKLPLALKLSLFLLHVVPWITQPIARLAGVQLLTLVLAGFGVYQILLLKRLAVGSAHNTHRQASI